VLLDPPYPLHRSASVKPEPSHFPLFIGLEFDLGIHDHGEELTCALRIESDLNFAFCLQQQMPAITADAGQLG